MSASKRIVNLAQLLKQLGKASENHSRVDIGTMMEVVGQKSFGPTLVFAGLIASSPLCSVPSMPTLMGLIVLLTTGQLLFGRKNFWLPQWILKRNVSRAKYEKALHWMQRPARFIDRLMHPRLAILTRGGGTYVVAGICALIGAAMIPMELIPFSVHIAGLALTAFGLALIAHDGAVAILAMIFTTVAAYAMIHTLL